jgi:large subunit ribosomal protein L20
MPRVKRGTTASKRRKNLLRHTKGFKWARKTHYRAAKEALLHAWTKSYYDRKKKKGDFRRLWQIKIGAAARGHELSYGAFVHGLKKANVELDRKVLALLAEHEPAVFEKIVSRVKENTTR